MPSEKKPEKSPREYHWKTHVALLRRCKAILEKMSGALPPKRQHVSELNGVSEDLDALAERKRKLGEELEDFKRQFWALRGKLIGSGYFLAERQLHMVANGEADASAMHLEEQCRSDVGSEGEVAMERALEHLVRHVEGDGIGVETAAGMFIRDFWAIRKKILRIGWYEKDLESRLRHLLTYQPALGEP